MNNIENKKNHFMDNPKYKTGYFNYKPIEIYKDIILFENFFLQEEMNYYIELLEKMTSTDWNSHGNYESSDFVLDVFFDRISLDIVKNWPVNDNGKPQSNMNFLDRILDLITPEYWSFQHTNFLKMLPGEKIEPMSSNFGEYDHSYVIAGYISDFEGGEITFPELNFEYKVKKGDLLIFPKQYSNGVKEVKSGIRYSYLDYMFAHPGYIIV